MVNTGDWWRGGAVERFPCILIFTPSASGSVQVEKVVVGNKMVVIYM